MIQGMLDPDRADREHLWTEFLAHYRPLIARCMRARLAARGQQVRTAELVDEFLSYLATGAVLRTADRAQGRFRCYLQGAIALFAKSQLRAGARHVTGLEEVLASVATGSDPQAEFEQQHDREYAHGLLHAALGRLHGSRPELATALAMRYGIHCEFWAGTGEQTSAEIAEALGLPQASTVRNHLQDARRTLRAMLRHDIGQTIHSTDPDEHASLFLDERSVVESHVEGLFPGLVTGADDA
jgi:DNA-directed RNA polymerase specialized sigma24 family protein